MFDMFYTLICFDTVFDMFCEEICFDSIGFVLICLVGISLAMICFVCAPIFTYKPFPEIMQ